ncbi:hypothetical protein ACGFZH_40360 [Streptomyces zaomyceticus]|uniref:hypothetical protein n=1 Tax=Streptomyces zaomyceticus TaxID=68286 RepID=UPI003713A078
MTDRTAKFAAVYALMRMAADLGDHWIQSDHQAVTKGLHGDHFVYGDGTPVPADIDPYEADVPVYRASLLGRSAACRHVATYTATQALMLLAGSRVMGFKLSPGRVAAALALSAGTHWWADRRIHLKALAVATGKGNFYELGGPLGGNYALDQAFHHLFETAAAAIAASK